MNDQGLLLEALVNTATSLEKHLRLFNPVINAEKNGIPEANLITQFAHQCLNNGWFVYPETSNVVRNSHDGKPIRIDLHVICEGQFMLTVEAKKLYSIEKAQEMLSDFKRAQTLNYLHDHNNLPHHVLLLAVTEITSNANWWCASENWDNISPTWKELAEILQRDGVLTSSLPMHDAHGKTHHLLYAISEVH
ncbi:hypothetical protein [Enterovibrio sp. FF113]|uniref:hypothetical protein n=1 Tax=Enterovibrio sp. FF113 TaxID=3230010 RepID=UPI00352E1D84